MKINIHYYAIMYTYWIVPILNMSIWIISGLNRVDLGVMSMKIYSSLPKSKMWNFTIRVSSVSCTGYHFWWSTGSLAQWFTNRPGDLGSIPGLFIPKTSKMVFDTSLLNTEQYKVRIKVTVKQFRESSNLHIFLLRCGTRSYEWGTQWELNSLMKVC